MWKSICLTIVATAGNNIGKVLQKRGTLILPPLSLKFNVILAYISNVTWITGLLMDLSGAGLLLLAISEAPVSVVQPVSGCGLAILSVFSHFYLKEIMNAVDWIAIVLAAVGTIGVGAGAEEQATSSILVSRLPLLILIIAFLFILLNGWVRLQRHKSKDQALVLHEVVEEVVYGVEAGILFGISSVISKIGFEFMKQGHGKFILPICISISVLCSTFGFVYQTRGLKQGRAIVVTTCGAVSAIVTGVLCGMYALGETLPSSPSARLMLLLGWVFIIMGVSLLVFSSSVVGYLPKQWRRLSRSGIERKPSSSGRAREANPSSTSSTLHHLLPSPAKEKP